MKHKVGDEVRIKSLDWYNKNKNNNGEVDAFVPAMSKYCGRIAKIVKISETGTYKLDLNKCYYWNDSMFDETSSQNQGEEVKLIWKKSKKINQDEKIKMESKRVKITLPKNCEVDEVKASVEDKFIVVEYTPKEKFKPKDGDICFGKMEDGTTWLFILREMGTYRYADIHVGTEISDTLNPINFSIGKRIIFIRLATEEEKDYLFEIMRIKGFKWDEKEKNVRKVKPRGGRGNLYHYIGIDGETHLTSEKFDCMDDKLYNCNNYFLSRLEAEEYAQKIRSILKDR